MLFMRLLQCTLFGVMVYKALLTLSAIAAFNAQKLEVFTGEPGEDRKYPFVVTFIRDDQRACSGMLIASNWVLTTGELAFNDGEYRVQYGNLSVLPSQAKLVSKVVRAVLHPSLRADIGHENYYSLHSYLQLVLVETIPLKQYAHISAIDYKTLTGISVEYTGLEAYPLEPDPGQVVPEYMPRPPLLGQGIITSCDSDSYMGIDLDGPMMCVASTCDKRLQSAWAEDSGGPLFYEGKVIGVLKRASNLSGKRYVAVSPFIDWIHLVMTQNRPDVRA